jgi:hypothetical protein
MNKKPIEACHGAFGIKVRQIREVLDITQDEVRREQKQHAAEINAKARKQL